MLICDNVGQAKGTITSITSTSGYVHTPYMGTYAATKRSIELITETLRLELQPFSVRVLSIVTGAVVSRGQTYMTDLKLPSSSLYKPIEETIVSRACGNDGIPRMPTMEYAERVVGEIVGGGKGKFWWGEHAEIVKGGTTNVQVPQDMMVSGLRGKGKEGMWDVGFLLTIDRMLGLLWGRDWMFWVRNRKIKLH